MRISRILALAALSLFASSVNCAISAASHIGTWSYEDSEVYVGTKLDKDGTCQFLLVAKHDVGFGGICKYSTKGQDLEITEMTDGSGNGSVEDWGRIRLKYTAATD